MTGTELKTHLRTLEEELWSKDPSRLASILAEHFTDFCRFGHVYDRDDIIDAPATEVEIGPMEDFDVDQLAPTVALVTYVNSVTNEGVTQRARRSSIWVNDDQAWRLRFVQATTLPE